MTVAIRRVTFAILTTLALAPAATAAQDPPAAPAAAQPAAASNEPSLAPFIDKNLGYELRLPIDWRYDRTGFFGPGGSLGLLRGVAPDGTQTVQILAFRSVRQSSFDEWTRAFTEQLQSVPGLVWARSTGDASAKRPSAWVIAEARDGLERWRTVYYCVQFDAGTNWVFSYSLALGKSGEVMSAPAEEFLVELVPPTIRDVLGTLRVFYNEKTATTLSDALERGKQYQLQYKLQEDVKQLRVDDKPRAYLILAGGKPIGTMSRTISRQKQSLDEPRYAEKGKDGVRVRETLWQFAEDGTARQSVIDLFCSIDGSTDLFDIWDASIPADEKLTPVTTRDQCIREGDILFSSVTSTAVRGLPEPRRPIRVTPSYLGMGWGRLLPALLGKRAADMFAFAVYDPETRALMTQGIQYIGDKPLPEGEKKTARVFELRDGFAEQTQKIYTDEFGALLRAEAGGVVIKLSTDAEVEKLLGPKRAAAAKRLNAVASGNPKTP